MAGWLLNIEAPLWASVADADEIKNQMALLDTLKDAEGKIDAMYFKVDFLNKICQGAKEDIGQWLKLIAQIQTIDYPDNPKALYLKTYPDIITDIAAEEQRTETYYQLEALFEEQNPKKIHVLTPDRVTGVDGYVDIVKDKKKSRRIYVTDAGEAVIGTCVASLSPKLNQAKHHSVEHNIGKGKVASPFTAWDKNDESYARQLLSDAFDHFTGNELPAKELYAWDYRNKLFVRFMHSGNNEYHGHDYPEKDVSDDVKAFMDLCNR